MARYDLAPAQLLGGFEYDLRPSRGTVGEWVFSVDPGLRVTDVVVNNRAGWTIDPPESPGGPRILRVALHQPGAGGKVLISTVAPFPDPTRPVGAPLPGVRPVGANLDDETIEIRLAPGLKPENWHAGDYRLTDAQVLADQGRLLTLTGTLLLAGSDQPFRRLPALRIVPAEVEYSTAEEIAWRFDADRAAIAARITLRVRRGTLFQFALRAPAGYGFVRAGPRKRPHQSRRIGGRDRRSSSRPLGPGQSVELTIVPGPITATRGRCVSAFIPWAGSAGVLAFSRTVGTSARRRRAHPARGSTRPNRRSAGRRRRTATARSAPKRGESVERPAEFSAETDGRGPCPAD